MEHQNFEIASAKNKIDQFVANDNNINAYNLAEEAEKVRRAEIAFARNEAWDEAWNKCKNETNRKIVQNMLKNNCDMTLIMDVTGLSEEVIKSYSK